jgi:hypothetical protein
MSNFPDMEYKPMSQALEVAPNATSLELLQAVYRSPSLPLATRMRAAMAALQFEHPKLGVSVNINGEDIAERLDRAIARTNGLKVIEQPKVIEALAEPQVSPAEMSKPFARRRA